MQIAKNKVASIEYRLTDDAGTVLDSSEGRPPLEYLHGVGQLIPGLEGALDGHVAGDALEVDVAPGDAYGERDEELVFSVDKTNFSDASGIEIGMRVQLETPDGTHEVSIAGIEEDRVLLDANHPLAGRQLHFSVKIVDVRDATPEEMQLGHAHDEGDNKN